MSAVALARGRACRRIGVARAIRSVTLRVPRSCMFRPASLWRVASLLILASSCPSRAETLAEALEAAMSAPRLSAARSRSEAVEQAVRRARAGYMPTIAAHADLTASNPRSAPFNSPPADSSMGFDVTVSPPLFDGGRTDASVRMAKASAQTERERVRGQEQELLLTAIAVYADVIMNRRLISVYERAASQWKQMVEATRQQMAVKEAAVADVAQADAALAGAVAQVVLARANLSASEAAFLEIFQHPPAVLEQAPGVELLLPRSEKAAAEANERFSPDIAIAIAQKQAAFHAIDRANADRLPTWNPGDEFEAARQAALKALAK